MINSLFFDQFQEQARHRVLCTVSLVCASHGLTYSTVFRWKLMRLSGKERHDFLTAPKWRSSRQPFWSCSATFLTCRPLFHTKLRKQCTSRDTSYRRTFMYVSVDVKPPVLCPLRPRVYRRMKFHIIGLSIQDGM